MDIKSPKKLEESGEDQLTQSLSMGCVPFGFCTEALRTLYIKAVLGEQDSPWCSPPQPGLAWASVSWRCQSLSSLLLLSQGAGLVCLRLLWQIFAIPILCATSFVQRVRGFWAASVTAEPSWCGCLSGCWLMLQTCGENETHQLWPGRIQGCSLILERLWRALRMQLCQKAAEISWPGSPPALLNTPGKSVFGTPHLQIRFWLLPEIHI